MPSKKVNKNLQKLNDINILEIIEKIQLLEIDETAKDTVILSINNINKKEKRSPPKIPKEKECTAIVKSTGLKCKAPKCLNNKCWPHLTTKEKEEYRKSKKSINKKS